MSFIGASLDSTGLCSGRQNAIASNSSSPVRKQEEPSNQNPLHYIETICYLWFCWEYIFSTCHSQLSLKGLCSLCSFSPGLWAVFSSTTSFFPKFTIYGNPAVTTSCLGRYWLWSTVSVVFKPVAAFDRDGPSSLNIFFFFSVQNTTFYCPSSLLGLFCRFLIPSKGKSSILPWSHVLFASLW